VHHEIATARLRLVSMGPALLRALLAGATSAAETRLGARVPREWPGLVEE